MLDLPVLAAGKGPICSHTFPSYRPLPPSYHRQCYTYLMKSFQRNVQPFQIYWAPGTKVKLSTLGTDWQKVLKGGNPGHCCETEEFCAGTMEPWFLLTADGQRLSRHCGSLEVGVHGILEYGLKLEVVPPLWMKFIWTIWSTIITN